MTDREDIAAVASQLADLTHTVEKMGNQLKEMRESAASQRERSDTQQERIDLAARELAEVSDRLQAAAKRAPSINLTKPFEGAPAIATTMSSLSAIVSSTPSASRPADSSS